MQALINLTWEVFKYPRSLRLGTDRSSAQLWVIVSSGGTVLSKTNLI